MFGRKAKTPEEKEKKMKAHQPNERRQVREKKKKRSLWVIARRQIVGERSIVDTSKLRPVGSLHALEFQVLPLLLGPSVGIRFASQ